MLRGKQLILKQRSAICDLNKKWDSLETNVLLHQVSVSRIQPGHCYYCQKKNDYLGQV